MPSIQLPWPSYALGVFILFQLVYLPTANAIKLIALRLSESKGELDDDIQLRGQAFGEPLQTAADAVGTAFVRWGELTGQAQGWSLFAPVFGHQASLPVVTIGGIEFSSDFDPRSRRSSTRWPSTSCRLFNYEYRLALLYWTWSDQRMREEPELWRKAGLQRVGPRHRSMESYMRWRVAYQMRPNSPIEITLAAELIPAPTVEAPGGANRRRFGFKIARLLPGEPIPAHSIPIQAWDAEHGWIWLPIEEPP